jgi:hypothetical protein
VILHYWHLLGLLAEVQLLAHGLGSFLVEFQEHHGLWSFPVEFQLHGLWLQNLVQQVCLRLRL